jgi:hypothetical protein
MFLIFLGFIVRHKSDGGSTLKQNTVIRESRLFVICISLVFGGKYMWNFLSFSHSCISMNTFEVDPPSDSLQDAVVKPKNVYIATYKRPVHELIVALKASFHSGKLSVD